MRPATKNKPEVCSFPMSLRCTAIEYREDVDLCATLMAAAEEIDRLRAFALDVVTDPLPDMGEYRARARKMLQETR